MKRYYFTSKEDWFEPLPQKEWKEIEVSLQPLSSFSLCKDEQGFVCCSSLSVDVFTLSGIFEYITGVFCHDNKTRKKFKKEIGWKILRPDYLYEPLLNRYFTILDQEGPFNFSYSLDLKSILITGMRPKMGYSSFNKLIGRYTLIQNISHQIEIGDSIQEASTKVPRFNSSKENRERVYTADTIKLKIKADPRFETILKEAIGKSVGAYLGDSESLIEVTIK